MRMDRPEPLLFNAWMRRFAADLLSALAIAGAPVGPPIDLVGQALSPAGRALCGGNCGQAAGAQASTKPLAALGPDWERATWGDRPPSRVRPPAARRACRVIGPLATWRIPQPGDDSTVFRGSPRPPGWDSVHGPGYRGVYDLADLDRSLFGVAPGQSGNPLSPDAASLMQRWRDGEPVRLGPLPQTVRDRIGLRP